MKPIPQSKVHYERWLNDNPPLGDASYIEYVRTGGTCWGHHYRKHHLAQFNKSYEEMWCRRPDLWNTDPEY